MSSSVWLARSWRRIALIVMVTSCEFSFYPYQFLMRDSRDSVPCLIYHFRSSRTNRWYVVRVEEYPNHFYGIKFYLKSDSNSPHKYNRLTGFNEPRPLIRTCIAILMEIAQNDPLSSFGFIGPTVRMRVLLSRSVFVCTVVYWLLIFRRRSFCIIR